MALARILGFAGGAIVDGVQVLVTSASFARERTISYMTMLDVPPTNDSRSRVAFADGVHVVTGNTSFDLTSQFMPKLTTSEFLRRLHQFDVTIHDGINDYTLEDCYWTSLSLSGAPDGLISTNLGFIARNNWSPGGPAISFVRNRVPYGYWYSGNEDVREWSLSLNQDVSPVYSNEDTVWPRYLRVGLWDATLEVTTYDQLQAHDTVVIATSSFTITGNTASDGYNFGGQSDLGTYTHSFQSGTVIDGGLSSAIDIISVV